MDPKYFPNPEKFDPYRFSDENKGNIQSGTFLPFGIGPRICLGTRYALLELKLLMYKILTKFRIEKCSRTPEKLTRGKGIAGYKEKIYVTSKLRK
jgi:cytochrome P450 family 9